MSEPTCHRCGAKLQYIHLPRRGSCQEDGPWNEGFFDRNGGNFPKPEIRWKLVCPVCSPSGATKEVQP